MSDTKRFLDEIARITERVAESHGAPPLELRPVAALLVTLTAV